MAPAPTKIAGKLRVVSSQRQQYKPYYYEMEFDTVLVEIDIPDAGVVKKGQTVTLNLNGFTAVLEQLADAIDRMDDAYVTRRRTTGKF